LAWEIRATLQMRPVGDWLVLPIANYVGDRRVRYGWTASLAATSEARLYRRDARRREESGSLPGTCAGALTGALRRVVAEDARGLLAWLAAQDSGAGRPGAAVPQFCLSYLMHGGWREGRLGLLIAVLCGLQPLLAGVKTDVVTSPAAAPSPGRLAQAAAR
jgi:hypothetical protein